MDVYALPPCGGANGESLLGAGFIPLQSGNPNSFAGLCTRIFSSVAWSGA